MGSRFLINCLPFKRFIQILFCFVVSIYWPITAATAAAGKNFIVFYENVYHQYCWLTEKVQNKKTLEPKILASGWCSIVSWFIENPLICGSQFRSTTNQNDTMRFLSHITTVKLSLPNPTGVQLKTIAELNLCVCVDIVCCVAESFDAYGNLNQINVFDRIIIIFNDRLFFWLLNVPSIPSIKSLNVKKKHSISVIYRSWHYPFMERMCFYPDMIDEARIYMQSVSSSLINKKMPIEKRCNNKIF